MPYKYFRLKPINLKKMRHEAWIFLLPKRKDYSALVGKRADPVALLPNMKLMPKNDIFPEGQEAFINSKEFFISAIFIVHLKSASCIIVGSWRRCSYWVSDCCALCVSCISCSDCLGHQSGLNYLKLGKAKCRAIKPCGTNVLLLIYCFLDFFV